MRVVVASAIASVTGCGTEVDVPPLPADYTSWKRLDVTGDAPGHGDTYRIIYANAIAVTPPVFNQYLPTIGYPEGSIFVKEIYENADGQPGAYRYTAIMRRIGVVTRPFEAQAGWVFTMIKAPTDREKSFDYCWARCHAAAPYLGAWYDYTKL